jgi:cysteinyl-tRNA synthetase
MVQVDGRKMSKSLGNFFTVQDKLAEGVPGEVIRLALLMTRYSEELDWTDDRVQVAEQKLERWRFKTEGVSVGEIPENFVSSIADDLNTPMCVARLDAMEARGDFGALKASGQLIGLLTPELGKWMEAKPAFQLLTGRLDDPYVGLIQGAWAKLREARDFTRADALRAEAARAGLELSAVRGGTAVNVNDSYDRDAVTKLFERWVP